MLLMHMVLQKGYMSKFVPCPLHRGTLVWTPSFPISPTGKHAEPIHMVVGEEVLPP